MANQLVISAGQYTDRGRKQTNQDFHGLCHPRQNLMNSKGFAIAVADGISSSDVSHIASQFAVANFLEDYYCTSESWAVKTSVERVLTATNSWLYSQTQQSQYRYDKDRGYVCTLSAMVIKSTTAHVFHVGDTRIYHLRGNTLEQLTKDHRVSVSSEQSYLSRALGIDSRLEIDYLTLQVEPGDMFLLATDGVYEYTDSGFVRSAIAAAQVDLEMAARLIGEEAFRRGSTDNLTVQLIRVEQLPSPEVNEMVQRLAALPFPPILQPRMEFDGYRIVREVHGSCRSHVYLAIDRETESVVILKTLSIDLQENPAQVEQFLMEEWVARRIDSAHVLKPCLQQRQRNFLYIVTEFIEGQTLSQWMIDHPIASIESVRAIIEQIGKGLRAFHRLEMLHQDLRPDNIMIDKTGTVKIIDFGSTSVAGVSEGWVPDQRNKLLGTPQFTAPEYFLGGDGSPRSDLFSLGVIAYQMLTGKLPYGTRLAQSTTLAAQRALKYRPMTAYRRDVAPWVDEAIKKAVHTNPLKRYEETSEFVFDLHHPNKAFLGKTKLPLIERNPVMFWKCVSMILLIVIVILIALKSPPR